MKRAKAGTALLLLLTAVLGLACTPIPAAERDGQALVQELLKRTGSQPALAVLLGADDGTFASLVGQAGPFLVHALHPDSDGVRQARARLQSEPWYGRVSIEHWADRSRLPYADNLVNFLVCDLPPEIQPPLAEIVRSLRPEGVALVHGAVSDKDLNGAGGAQVQPVAGWNGWHALVKTRPAAMDDWTHSQRHGPDGSRVSRDTLAGPPAQVRWIAESSWPRNIHHPKPDSRSPVFSQGRMFYVFQRDTPVTKGPLNLMARDAHNGLLLWTREVEDLRKSARGLIAQPWGLLVALTERGPYSLLNPNTGEEIRNFPEMADMRTEPIFYDDHLIASAGGHLVAVHPQSGAVRWRHEEQASSLIAVDGSLFYRCGTALVRRDAASGAQRWRIEDAADWSLEVIRNAYGDGVLVAAGGKTLRGFSAQDGRLLWTSDIRSSFVFFLDGLFWAGDGGRKNARNAWVALQPQTGKVAKEIAPPQGYWLKGRCTLPMATPKYLLGDSMEFIFREGGAHADSRMVRNACGVGFIPANGLIYTLPHSCRCYPTLRGTLGLAPASPERAVSSAPRLVRGPASINRPEKIPAPSAEDWPVYRHDARRSGVTGVSLPATLSTLWKSDVAPDGALQADWPDNPIVSGRLTSPVVSSGLLVVGMPDRHQIAALEAATGAPRWRFTAGGRVDSPPTLFAGLCLFGCRDGWVYGLRAADGELAWKFRAAPDEQFIMAHGQLESAWPVFGSPIVEDGKVYAAAGRHSEAEGGIVVYALDAWTGATLWSHPWVDLSVDATNARAKGMANDLLLSDGTTLHLAGRHLSLAEGKPAEARQPLIFARGGMLDRGWGSRGAWHDAGGSPEHGVSAQLMVAGASATYGVRAFPGGYGKKMVGSPGRYELFARFYREGERTGTPERGSKNEERDDGDETPDTRTWKEQPLQRDEKGWSRQLPVQVRALALAGRFLVTAGMQDDTENKASRLEVFDAATGESVAKLDLPAPPVYDGFAVAAGRLYLALQNGTLLCLGAPSQKAP